LVWATLIAYSRIYLGAHYPLDVLMGAIVGGLGAWALFLTYAKLTKKP
jgi:undecaprenyl-diphosphatase